VAATTILCEIQFAINGSWTAEILLAKARALWLEIHFRVGNIPVKRI